MNGIGIDIGTTSICLTVIDSVSGEVRKAVNLPNCYGIDAAAYEACQDAEKITDVCIGAADKLMEEFAPVCSIGITGQMHGIVYLDENGKAVSPLYTWQDASGNRVLENSGSYAEKLSEITGYKMATGYGGTTCYCHFVDGKVPENARRICTVHDYLCMKLCGLKEPVMHSSDCASFGLFDLGECKFDKKAITDAGMDASLFPDAVDCAVTAGTYRGIPVCVAIGDNQASFIGSVDDDGAVLINIGTGSQVSYVTDSCEGTSSMEVRPLHNGSYIRVGAALCGGRAFASLEKFIRDTINLSGADISSAYKYIDAYLESSPCPDDRLGVDTRFCGTRENPALRGGIGNLGLDNFTPGHLIYGVLEGISGELFAMYGDTRGLNHTSAIGSGNGLRKNKALQKIIADMFGLPLKIPAHKEEAAYGAALYGMTAAGIFASLDDARRLIRYI